MALHKKIVTAVASMPVERKRERNCSSSANAGCIHSRRNKTGGVKVKRLPYYEHAWELLAEKVTRGKFNL